MKKFKWWQWGLIGLFGMGALGAIAEQVPTPKPAERKFADVDAEFNLIAGKSIFAMTFDPRADPEKILAEARAKCTRFDFCQVHGWIDAERAAGNMPFTDREVEAIEFAYSLNRSTSLDRGLWNCRRWKRSTATECLAD